MNENSSKKINNKIMWGAIALAIMIVVTTAIAVIMIVQERTKTISVAATQSKALSSTSDIEEDTIEMNELTSVEEASEEELKKINEKEVEEAKKKDTKATTETKKKYYIKVNYGAQVVNVYTYDKDGNYTIPVKAFVCSTGRLTPISGVYTIPAKVTWCHMIGDVWAHYCTQIVGDILFHSVPSLEKNTHSLEYWEYDKLGTKASLGCVRMTVRDAKWIFDNVSVGTKVEFYSSSNPGPLGKPTAQKISNAPEELRVWDPTDPDFHNPWKNYHPEEENKNTVVNEQTPNIINNEVAQNQNIEQNNNVAQNQENTTTQNTETSGNQTESGQIANEQTGNNQNSSQTVENQENTNNQENQDSSDQNTTTENREQASYEQSANNSTNENSSEVNNEQLNTSAESNRQ